MYQASLKTEMKQEQKLISSVLITASHEKVRELWGIKRSICKMRR